MSRRRGFRSGARAGGGAPDPIAAILSPGSLHFDANNGFTVSSWTDLKGNYNATQGTGGSQPTLVTNVSPTGLSAVRFDTGKNMRTAAFAAAMATTTIIAVVGLHVLSASSQFVSSSLTNGGRQNINFNVANTGAGQIFAGGTARTWTSLWVADALHLIVAQFNGNSTYFSVDGTRLVNGLSAGSNALDGLTLGASNTPSASLQGYIGEYLLMDYAASDAAVAAATGALKAKWGTP